jgi:very-short-patch-repair endonuclease
MKRVDPKMTARARALRSSATPEERAIWERISAFRPRFTRQLTISDSYVADLACRKAWLAIELDGSQHVDSAYDVARTAHLTSLGWRVIRFWNSDVHANPDGVAQAILEKAADCLGGVRPEAIAPRVGRVRRPRSR